MTTQNISFEELANKCMTQIKNALYFQYKPLSPAIYRMKTEWLQPGAGLFGTDSYRIYADPMNVIMRLHLTGYRLGTDICVSLFTTYSSTNLSMMLC